VEMRKELGKAKIKAARANGADPPYHWHHTLQRAIDSLVAYEGPVESPQDLVGIPHFGKFVRSLATTCWHHARLADPTNSSRPKRHRDGTPTPARRAYHPHYRGFAFATLYYFRRFNARSVPELISVDEKHRVAAAPIIVTKKGWQGSPLADLAQRGLVTGNASAGWSLTPAGEEVADACCARWDEGEQEPKRQRQSMGLGDDDTEAAEPEADPDAADSDKPQQRQQRSRQPAKPSGPVSAFASDFYDVGSQEDEDEIVILDRTHRSSSSASAASSSASSPHASSPSSASSAGPSPAAPAGPSAAGPSPALSGKDEKA